LEKRDHILSKIELIFKSFFKDESIILKTTTTANNISDWDSFTHMNLMSEIETQFEIEIPFDVIMDLDSVGELAAYIHNVQKTTGN
jgi:acyl carrier protein